MGLAVYNAFIVYKVKQDSSLTYQKFRQNLVRQIVEEHHTPRKPSTGGRPSVDNSLCLTSHHFPSEIPSIAYQWKNTCRHCKVYLTTKKVPAEKAEDEVYVQAMQHSTVSNREVPHFGPFLRRKKSKFLVIAL